MSLEDNIVSIPKDMMTNHGESVEGLSHSHKVMLVFLRHFGCIFCREALMDLGNKKEQFEKEGVKMVFIHMSDPEMAYAYSRKYKLEKESFVSDPSCHYYEHFGLVKGSFNQLFGLKNWMRGFEATMKGNMIGIKQIGDGFQMPGIFLLENGVIIDQYIHRFAADKPDYENLINCCQTQ